MTRLVALLLVATAPAGPPPAERFERANALYRAGDFSGAASEYEALAAEGLTSPSLHLNLGNARMRLGRRGAAIASWERALRLDPGDEDAAGNLAAARADDPDRALTGEPTLLARLLERTPDAAAVAVFLLPWWTLWGALALRTRRFGSARTAVTGLAVVAALGVLGGATLLAGKARDGRHAVAVVIAPSTPVRAGPSPALKVDFELHEGTRVRVRELQGDRVRIRLAGGLEGWMARDDLEAL